MTKLEDCHAPFRCSQWQGEVSLRGATVPKQSRWGWWGWRLPRFAR